MEDLTSERKGNLRFFLGTNLYYFNLTKLREGNTNVFYLLDFNLMYSVIETGCDNVKFIVLHNYIKCIEVVRSIV